MVISKQKIEDNTLKLIEAAKCGDCAEIQRLIPLSNPKLFNSEALWKAAIAGYPKAVELLIPVSEPKIDRSSAFRWAVRYNQHETALLLLPVSNPNEKDNEVFRFAVDNDNIQTISMLLPFMTKDLIYKETFHSLRLGNLTLLKTVLPYYNKNRSLGLLESILDTHRGKNIPKSISDCIDCLLPVVDYKKIKIDNNSKRHLIYSVYKERIEHYEQVVLLKEKLLSEIAPLEQKTGPTMKRKI